MRILVVSRALRYSPDAVSRDARVLALAIARLHAAGHALSLVDEDSFAASPHMPAPHDAIVHMARSEAALVKLEKCQQQGIRVVNSPAALLRHPTRCARLDRLAAAGVSVPDHSHYEAGQPYAGAFPVWLKALRNDTSGRWVHRVADADALASFQQRAATAGITAFSVEAPLEGVQVKCYGVVGTSFVRCIAAEGVSLSSEAEARVLQTAAASAEALGMEIYGGDAMVSADGVPCVFDMNDFPSFGPFAEEAAEAIANLFSLR
ncbi:MAG: hypothetical protein IJS89_07245 [Bacteroidaceae bacterium]|nr:hypothetical protein [Bacteroidaceae bacterium]